jgi:phosphoenolpyruvate-protein phosphotransferase (PTS system enzyme I)
MKTFQGIAASPGYAVGPVHSIRPNIVVPRRRAVPSAEIEGQIDLFKTAVDKAKQQMQELILQLEHELGPDEAAILSAQLMILEDPMVWDATLATIRLEKINAEAAFARAVAKIAARFLEIEDETFRERVNDLRDIEQRVLRAFLPPEATRLQKPQQPSIIAAANLAPSDTAAIGRDNVLGFVMDEGGNTSHVAILARSIGVPAVVGLKGRASSLKTGATVAVDGVDGELLIAPDTITCDRFTMLTRQLIVIDERLAGLKDYEAITPDGHRVKMMANIELPVEVDEALARGAEGIGLLRTEYLFFQHQSIPTEDEQVTMYAEIIRRMDGKPVIFRTLDVGGDKVSDYLGAKREYNPFLGWRGIRFSLANRTLFKTQIKAIFRSAVDGSAKIMFPMITGVKELREARAVTEEALAELKAANVDHNPDLDIGIMIETPSAVLCADLLAKECDFFSVGSNDLIQYTLAMDRGNSRVSYLYRPLHPALLRSLKMIVEAGHHAGIWVGICGEMASETRLAEVLLGLGFDEISLHGAALPKIKQVIRWTNVQESQKLVDSLLELSTADETDAFLKKYVDQRKSQREVENGNG